MRSRYLVPNTLFIITMAQFYMDSYKIRRNIIQIYQPQRPKAYKNTDNFLQVSIGISIKRLPCPQMQNYQTNKQQNKISSNNSEKSPLMSYNAQVNRPASTGGPRKTGSQHGSVSKRTGSSYKVRPEDLSALKQRVKLRNQNKQNNPLFRSDNLTSVLSIAQRFQAKDNGIKTKNIPHMPVININEFQIGDLLGRGAQAKVRMAIHKPTGSIYSIKSIQREKIEKNLDSFIRSLKIQMFLDHPNIAKIYGITVQEKFVHIIMQYCSDGDLSMNVSSLLRENKNLKNILLRVTQGLHYLHARRIHHRDVKLQNILLNLGVPKITDFELSVYTKLDFFPRKTMCGSPAYFCPEMIEKQRYNKKADIWCLGIVFYEMMCGYFPFDLQDYEDLKNITQKEIKAFPLNFNKLAMELITKMLCKDCENRISIQEILEHEFFRQQVKDTKEATQSPRQMKAD